DGMVPVPYHVSAKSPMRVADHARAPMPCRHVRDGQPVRVMALVPPVQFYYVLEAKEAHYIGDMPWYNQRGRPTRRAPRHPHDSPQRRPVQVIEVRMRDQHVIDGRKLADKHSRVAQ